MAAMQKDHSAAREQTGRRGVPHLQMKPVAPEYVRVPKAWVEVDPDGESTKPRQGTHCGRASATGRFVCSLALCCYTRHNQFDGCLALTLAAQAGAHAEDRLSF